ncbi:hypothetical protein CJF30_00000248 [Rutstroemia sp. NJR-2017a BBW]|nr:hypothetical protein CJF30_00000248 [Rutstroemia sp. NJR-2017a BBW]
MRGRGRGTDGRSREEAGRGNTTRGDKSGSSSVNQVAPRKAPAWAKPPPLVTVAQKDLSEEEAARAAAMKQFLKQPKADERFTAIGLYQWPRKSDVPAKIFGEQLKDLDKLRTGWRVYIDWNVARKCILIRATSPTGSEDVIEVMEGIRQAAESARAHSLTAAPLYIAVPPRSSAESTILLATVDTVARSDGKKHLYDIKFSEKATDEQLSECFAKMKKMVETNEDKLHNELSTQLALNKLFKNKMRMRVNFGRLHLTHWQTELSDSRQTFAGFVKMMSKRTRIASVFEKESVSMLSSGSEYC